MVHSNPSLITPAINITMNFLPKIFTFKHWMNFVELPSTQYNRGAVVYGFDGITPGKTFMTGREPLFVRRINNLPPVGTGQVPAHCHRYHP